MRVALLDQEYELGNGADTVRFLALLAEKVTWLKSQVVRIGNDTITTAQKIRSDAEWLRRNWGQGGAAAALGGNGGATMALAAGLLGTGSKSQPAPQPAPAPAPTPDPHKNVAPKIIPGTIAPPITGGGGTVEVLTTIGGGPTPSDRTFWMKIDTQAGNLGPGQQICQVEFGTPYVVKPTPQLTLATSINALISVENVTTTGFSLSSPFPLAPGTVLGLMFTVSPTLGDPNF